MKSPLGLVNVVIAISAGLIVLLGYFVPGLDFLSDTLLRWAVILAAFALVVGVVNLISVHARKVMQRKPGAVYSGVVILSFLITLVMVGISTPTGTWGMWIFENIQMPVEASLMAILVVTLAYSSMGLLRRRSGPLAVIFVLTALLVLLGSAPVYMIGKVPMLSWLRDWLVQVWAIGGTRGILIGVALGTVATGLRILMGIDRPYGS